jgi:hypothetical protein
MIFPWNILELIPMETKPWEYIPTPVPWSMKNMNEAFHQWGTPIAG